LRNKSTTGEYLAFLSVKYEVDPEQLFQALISAWENRESTCGNIRIACRKKIRDKATFLITRGDKVVAQFPIPNSFLMEESNPIARSRNTGLIQRYLVKKINRRPHSLHIADLKTGMKRINLKAKVMEIPKPKSVFTRFGNYAAVTNALISDETGDIKLCLWNEQISSISEGDTIQIKNARASVFRGEQQLRIGRNGELSVLENTESNICR
jgi:replication factor A1